MVFAQASITKELLSQKLIVILSPINNDNLVKNQITPFHESINYIITFLHFFKMPHDYFVKSRRKPCYEFINLYRVDNSNA